MSKILYYCDLHHGDKDRTPYDAQSVQLNGTHATSFQRGLSTYINKNGISTAIHGGDESLILLPYKKSDHLHDALTIAGMMTNVDYSLHRVIGNHEPVEFLDILGLKNESYATRENGTSIIICQPSIKQDQGITLYSYDTDKIIGLIDQEARQSDNIIIASHWSLDRLARGYNKESSPGKGYQYIDTTQKIVDALDHIEVKGSVLSLHGHEHRFIKQKYPRFECCVMPAITQGSIGNSRISCGLFAEITDNGENGRLTIEFKTMTLGKNKSSEPSVETVTESHMQEYFRPVTKSLKELAPNS